MAFHLALVPVTLLLLYAFSFPGLAVLPLAAAMLLLLGAAAVWVARAVTYRAARRNGTATGSPRWFAVAPVAALVVAGLIAGAVPLRLRWAAARPEFEQVQERLARRRRLPPLVSEEGNRIGTYEIHFITRVGSGTENTVFQEGMGYLFSDAGFAYLPDGPTADLHGPGFESPRWRSLGDGWYAWTAGW